MNSKLRPLYFLVVVSLLFAPLLRAQENPSADTDLTKMLQEAQDMQKEAEEIQKQNPTAPGKKKTMAEMQAEAKAELARMEAQEKKEKEALQAALKKQLAEPGPTAFPAWTPKTPQFNANGPPAKKIVDDEVRIIQTGTSTLTPKELADGWEAGSAAAGNLTRGRNNSNINGTLTTITYLSTHTDPVEKVELEATRAPEEKITRVTISSPLPKPEIASE